MHTALDAWPPSPCVQPGRIADWELRLTETRVIVACAEHKVHWYLGAEPAKCTDPAALRSLLDRARAGEPVEVGCLGGH